MQTKPKTTLPAFTPVARKCQRHDGWTPQRQRDFVELLADYGSVRAAANAVGMTPESAYQLRRQKGAAGFRRAWEAALDLGVQRIEDTAMERALNGVDVPVFCYGKLVGKRTVFNDRLLMFMLRNRAPARFAEGRAGALSALDKTRLAQIKKEWHREWTRAAAIKDNESEEETYRSLNAKLELMRQREDAMMSPRTRELYEEFKRSEQQDKQEGYPHLRTASDNEDPDQDPALPPPEWYERLKGARPPEEDKDEGPRVRTLKDGGW